MNKCLLFMPNPRRLWSVTRKTPYGVLVVSFLVLFLVLAFLLVYALPVCFLALDAAAFVLSAGLPLIVSVVTVFFLMTVSTVGRTSPPAVSAARIVVVSAVVFSFL